MWRHCVNPPVKSGCYWVEFDLIGRKRPQKTGDRMGIYFAVGCGCAACPVSRRKKLTKIAAAQHPIQKIAPF
jgi:hypothetical protein